MPYLYTPPLEPRIPPASVTWAGLTRGLAETGNTWISDIAMRGFVIALGGEETLMGWAVAVKGDVTHGSKPAEVLYSTSSGNLWNSVDLTQWAWGGTVNAISVDATGDGVAIVGFDDSHLLRTTNFGADWQEIALTAPGPLRMNEIRCVGNVWMVSLGANSANADECVVLRSEDLGENWTRLPDGLVGLQAGLYRTTLCFDRNPVTGRWWAGQSNGYSAYSDDNGASWTAGPRNLGLPENEAINTIRWGYDNVWLGGMTGGFCCRSNDDGATWNAVTLVQDDGAGGETPTSEHVYRIRFGDGRYSIFAVAVLGNGHACYSITGGLTWNSLDTGLNSGNNTDWESLAVMGNVWIAGSTGGYAARAIPVYINPDSI
jgi:hypothetical protein